jgi:hypothetical protein
VILVLLRRVKEQTVCEIVQVYQMPVIWVNEVMVGTLRMRHAAVCIGSACRVVEERDG